jgi:hypothetical protein
MDDQGYRFDRAACAGQTSPERVSWFEWLIRGAEKLRLTRRDMEVLEHENHNLTTLIMELEKRVASLETELSQSPAAAKPGVKQASSWRAVKTFLGGEGDNL